MSTLNLEYLTNQDGEAIAVVIPIDIWRQLVPNFWLLIITAWTKERSLFPKKL